MCHFSIICAHFIVSMFLFAHTRCGATKNSSFSLISYLLALTKPTHCLLTINSKALMLTIVDLHIILHRATIFLSSRTLQAFYLLAHPKPAISPGPPNLLPSHAPQASYLLVPSKPAIFSHAPSLSHPPTPLSSHTLQTFYLLVHPKPLTPTNPTIFSRLPTIFSRPPTLPIHYQQTVSILLLVFNSSLMTLPHIAHYVDGSPGDSYG